MSNSELITMIVKIIFAVLSVAITYYLLPFLESLKENYTDEKFKVFLNESVRAAEQVIKGNGKGSEKKDKVLKEVSVWLLKNKIEISETELNNMIESLVYDMNHPEGRS